MEVYEVVKKLIGEIDPVGSSHVDEKRYDNLTAMITLAGEILGDISYVARSENDSEHSVSKAGKRARAFLSEIYACEL